MSTQLSPLAYNPQCALLATLCPAPKTVLNHLFLESLYIHSIKQTFCEHPLGASSEDSKVRKEPCSKSDHPAVVLARVWGRTPYPRWGLVDMASCHLMYQLCPGRRCSSSLGGKSPSVEARSPKLESRLCSSCSSVSQPLRLYLLSVTSVFQAAGWQGPRKEQKKKNQTNLRFLDSNTELKKRIE